VNDEVIMPVDKAPIHLAVEAGAADIVQQLLAAGTESVVLLLLMVLLVVALIEAAAAAGCQSGESAEPV
jgi:hypothetical protein